MSFKFSGTIWQFDIAAVSGAKPVFSAFFCDTTGGFCFLFGIAVKKNWGKRLSSGVNGPDV